MRRRTLIVGGSAVAVLGTATAAGLRWHDRPVTPVAGTGPATGAATVMRTDLTSTTQVQGALGYQGTCTVVAQGPGGTVTALPEPGRVIQRGETVYELDGVPVRLFYGDRPAWRPLAAGMTDGADVRALEENLVALGHLRGAPDGHFNASTAAAVRRWQASIGRTRTGRVDLGAVTFQPGPVRVAQVQATLGEHAGGPVLTATSTVPVVSIQIPATQTYLVHPGDAVTVTMPDGSAAQGTVTALSAVAQAGQQSVDGRAAAPTASGTVTLAQQATGTGLDQAPVLVAITSRRAPGVLAVPIVALVALAGGGYGVYVRDGSARRLVGVQPGLFADTLVEIKGDALREGDTVEVPAT